MRPAILAVAGLAGAGKTTALGELSRKLGCETLYVGAFVLEEVGRRGLEQTAQAERHVRTALREERGRDVLAQMVVERLGIDPAQPVSTLDAVYLVEELECYRAAYGPRLVLLGIQADFEVRAARLGRRADRPLTRHELQRRDALELNEFRTGEVLAAADATLVNEGSLEDFKRALQSWTERW